MKVPYIFCNVKQDTYTTTNNTILPHELELLSVRRDKAQITNIKPTGQFRDITEEDMEREYNRLRATYGKDSDDGRWYVEKAFGNPHEGRLWASVERGTKHFSKSAQGIAGAAKAKANKKAKAAAEPAQAAA